MCSSTSTSESAGPDNWVSQKKISTIFWDVPAINAVVIQMTAKLITLLADCFSKTIIPTEILFFIKRKGKKTSNSFWPFMYSSRKNNVSCHPVLLFNIKVGFCFTFFYWIYILLLLSSSRFPFLSQQIPVSVSLYPWLNFMFWKRSLFHLTWFLPVFPTWKHCSCLKTFICHSWNTYFVDVMPKLSHPSQVSV